MLIATGGLHHREKIKPFSAAGLNGAAWGCLGDATVSVGQVIFYLLELQNSRSSPLALITEQGGRGG